MNHLIDTNVLLSASVHIAKDGRDVAPSSTTEREAVFHWLDAFVTGNEFWVLDSKGRIEEEYNNKQTYQDFSIQALLDKQSRSQVFHTDVDYDPDGFAILPDRLASVAWDNSDKKFVAAGLYMVELGQAVQIVNASDTDWYDVAGTLKAENIGIVQVIDGWCRATYREQNGREPPP